MPITRQCKSNKKQQNFFLSTIKKLKNEKLPAIVNSPNECFTFFIHLKFQFNLFCKKVETSVTGQTVLQKMYERIFHIFLKLQQNYTQTFHPRKNSPFPCTTHFQIISALQIARASHDNLLAKFLKEKDFPKVTICRSENGTNIFHCGKSTRNFVL